MPREWLTRTLLRLKALLMRRRLDRDLEEELRFHLAMREEKSKAAGVAADEAHAVARRRFGNVTLLKEACREMWTFTSLETLWQDIRYGARVMGRNRGFTLVLVAILALGIGGTTAVYSVVDVAILRPLPFPRANELMTIDGLMYPKEIDASYWVHNPAFDQLAEYQSGGVNLSVGNRAERVSACEVSASFFSVLEVAPAIGRGFLPQEEAAGQNHVVVLSNEVWVRNLNSDPATIGRSIRLNGVPHTIVGVMPSGFDFPENSQIWIPKVPRFGRGSLDLGNNPADMPRVGHNLGRLKPGITPEQATKFMTSLSLRLLEQYGVGHANDFIRVRPLQATIVRNVRAALFTLLAAVAFLLLIVCSNAANMLLGRVAVRQKEFAVRLCLGATRLRIARQLITESLLLALSGGVFGILFARWFLELIRRIAPPDVPRLATVRIDPRILLFAVGISSLVGIFVGLLPAIQALAPRFTSALKEESYRSTGAMRKFLRGVLVVGEIALSLVLLSGAGLMIQSLYHLTLTELGFNPNNVVTIDLDVPETTFPHNDRNASDTNQSKQDDAKSGTVPAPPSHKLTEKEKDQQETKLADPASIARALFHQQLLEKVRSVPGVVAAGTASNIPLKPGGGFWYFDVDGKPTGMARSFYVSDGYFRAMGIPLIAGRPFTETESLNNANTVIISQSLARAVWPRRNPVGQHLQVEASESVPLEIIGVAGDVTILDGSAGRIFDFWQFYFPGQSRGGRTLVVRTSSDPGKMIVPLRSVALSMDRDTTAYNAKTMNDVVSTFETPQRFRAMILGLFAFVALTLAVLGVYGVTAYSVACRTHEIGVRISLGAGGTDILRLILGGGMRLAALGVALGVGLSLALNRLLQSLLFGISAADPRTLAWSAGVLVLGALMACLIPARRAMSVDPMVALRYE